MQKNKFLLYGANGYTGELIARFAEKYGLAPVLAGRRKEAIEPLAAELGLSFRIFDLDDNTALRKAMDDIQLVVHAAGPYDFTARPMMEACLETGTHYLDLNGDTDVFEMLQGYNSQAFEKDIMVMPGAGFDVVPTDCLALWLKKQLPDATDLKIAFAIVGSALSRGTSITTLQKLGMPGAIRKNGVITPERVGKRGRRIGFVKGRHKIFVMSIPWGDLSTAYFSTGIPNIETYTSISKPVWLLLKGQFLFNWILRTSLARSIIRSIIHRKAAGPDEPTRNKASSLIWAKVTNPGARSLTARMQCPEAYSLTAFTVLLIAGKILAGDYKAGYQTPASAYGENLIMEVPGVVRSAAAEEDS
ncbi:MAG: saccharopine dehydrogenase NADP-binding domain-containing protein [Chitinophagaceae bacterium]|nr:saccharopine dehydrogenase NADP-binding domain-containing protein [Chitinophagaceae bacterium]